MNKILTYKKWAKHKKKLRLRRKNKHKAKFVPRVIVDTNIWYMLGSDDKLFNLLKGQLVPVYNNLWEMANTGLLHDPVKIEKVRNSIRKMMLCSKLMISVEPLRYLIKMGNRSFDDSLRKSTINMLLFTQKIAQGYTIDVEKQNEFYSILLDTKNELDKVKFFFNEAALECKRNIKNYRKHRKSDTKFLIIELLDSMARMATENKFNLKKVPLGQYELLVLVMDCFFKKLETGELQWQRNDLFDLFNLTYVRRGDKYWTKEKRWIHIIEAAGCASYLYYR